MRRICLAGCMLAMLIAPASASAACADADLVPTALNLDRVEAATFCLHNEERAKAGLPELRWSTQLAASADAHSLDMVNRRFFAHDAPPPLASTPRERIEATGYGPSWSGENILYGAGGGYTPAEAVEGWMNSPGHRANILRPEFDHIGLGLAFGVPAVTSLAGATYTANFGSRTAPDDETIGLPPGYTTGPGADPEPVTEEEVAEVPVADGPGATSKPTGKAKKRKQRLRKCVKKARKQVKRNETLRPKQKKLRYKKRVKHCKKRFGSKRPAKRP